MWDSQKPRAADQINDGYNNKALPREIMEGGARRRNLHQLGEIEVKGVYDP